MVWSFLYQSLGVFSIFELWFFRFRVFYVQGFRIFYIRGLSFFIFSGLNGRVIELVYFGVRWLRVFFFKFIFSDVIVIIRNQLCWEYLYCGNWQMLLIAVFFFIKSLLLSISSIFLGVGSFRFGGENFLQLRVGVFQICVGKILCFLGFWVEYFSQSRRECFLQFSRECFLELAIFRVRRMFFRVCIEVFFCVYKGLFFRFKDGVFFRFKNGEFFRVLDSVFLDLGMEFFRVGD